MQIAASNFRILYRFTYALSTCIDSFKKEKRIKVLVFSDVKRSFHPPHLGMRIGDDYQAVIPEFDPDNKPESNHDAMLVWAPKPALNEQKLDDYVTLAKEKYGYNAGKNS